MHPLTESSLPIRRTTTRPARIPGRDVPKDPRKTSGQISLWQWTCAVVELLVGPGYAWDLHLGDRRHDRAPRDARR